MSGDTEKKTLHLTLKKKWFDLIASGVKKEEYREIRQYWAARFLHRKEEMEHGVFEEMVEDMRKPFLRHHGPGQLMEYFGVFFKEFDVVRFKNGYSKDAPVFTVPLKKIIISTGNTAWGADPGVYYFCLLLGE